MSTLSPASPSMSASCSRRSRIRCVCSAALLWGAVLCRPLAAQQLDEAQVGELARLLAAADARNFDAALLSSGLRDADERVRRQAALAAGRIGDPAAVDLLIPALSDSSPGVQAAAAFALGLLKDSRAAGPLLALVRAVPERAQGAPQIEGATALVRIGGAVAAADLREILGNGYTPGVATPPARRAALLEGWRLGERAPVNALAGYVDDADPGVRWRALFSLGRLRARQGAALLVSGLRDPDPQVRAIAARSVTRQFLDSAHVAWRGVADQLRPLLSDPDAAVRINTLRTLASFHDSALAQAAIPLLSDALLNVAGPAATTLGVLGGSASVAAPRGRGRAAAVAPRRRAVGGAGRGRGGGVLGARAPASPPSARSPPSPGRAPRGGSRSRPASFRRCPGPKTIWCAGSRPTASPMRPSSGDRPRRSPPGARRPTTGTWYGATSHPRSPARQPRA